MATEEERMKRLMLMSLTRFYTSIEVFLNDIYSFQCDMTTYDETLDPIAIELTGLKDRIHKEIVVRLDDGE